MTWRFLGFAEPAGTFLGEVVVVGAEVTQVLSGPGRLTGTIPAGCAPDWVRPWACSLYAENGAGEVLGGGFLTPVDVNPDGSVAVDCVGRAGYPKAMPWTDSAWSGVQVDPLDIVRRIWTHLQSKPAGDIGVQVDATRSPVRVGTEPRDVSFTTGAGQDVSFEAGPFALEWWSDLDLGAVIDKLAAATPFDYLEETAWDTTRTRLVHRLRLGYPALGTRRHDLRLEVGVNITAVPVLGADDGDYATECLALGAGEGRSMVWAELHRGTGGVRRVVTFTDSDAQNKAALIASAKADLGWRTGQPRVEDIEVIDHPLAPLSALSPGTEVLLTGGDGPSRLDRWVRIVSLAVRPEADTAAVRVIELDP